MAPPPPPPPPPLTDLSGDVTAEILLRLPPDEPEHLFRAALVCKPWLRILCDPGFLRRYRAFHGAPPLLGLLHRLQVSLGDPAPRFASTTSMPDFPHPGSHGGRTRPLDCRHGRVLIHMFYDEGEGEEEEEEEEGDGDEGGGAEGLGVDLLVWDPITGERHAVPEPDMDWMVYTAAVLCAADGCNHLDCHGGPFRVVFLATDDCDLLVKATVYSSVTGVWSAPVSIHDGCEFYAKHKRDRTAQRGYYFPCVHTRRVTVIGRTAQRGYYFPYVHTRRVTVIGDQIYFILSRNTAIVKYDCGKNCLCLIGPPPPDTEVYGTLIALMVMDGNSLGFAGIEGSSLHLWTRKVKGAAAEWVQCRVIDLDKSMPMAKPWHGAGVVGFAEGVDVIFIDTYAGLFTFGLKSGMMKKLAERGAYYSILPYMSFYTPDRGAFLQLASGEVH